MSYQMSYQESVQSALDQIEDSPVPFSKGDGFLEDGFWVECVGVLEEDEDKVLIFVCIDMITRGIHFHYFSSSLDPDVEPWGFTFSVLCNVGREIELVYRNWLDSNGYSLAPEWLKLEEEPGRIERIIGWRIRSEEMVRLADHYEKIRDKFALRKANFLKVLAEEGWVIFDRVHDYPGGIAISPLLAAHKDWEERAYRNEEEGHYFINELTSSLPGENDWSDDIVEL